MGLAAGQARLLSITRRKSDCEFLSMNYSHQKLAISRELEMLSNNYSNSLNKTRLLYDFYGTNSEAGAQALNYNLLMTPNALNDYIPKLITTNSGKVVLDAKYAAAARAAGIPPEGYSTGSLPSDTVRNQFIAALAGQNMISQAEMENLQSISYNQALGLGAVDSLSYDVVYTNYDEILNLLSDSAFPITLKMSLGDIWTDQAIYNGRSEISQSNKTITLGELLQGDYRLFARCNIAGEWEESIQSQFRGNVAYSQIMSELESLFKSDTDSLGALEFARNSVQSLINSAGYNYKGKIGTSNINDAPRKILNESGLLTSSTSLFEASYYDDKKHKAATMSISLSDIARYYLACYVAYYKMENFDDDNYYNQLTGNNGSGDTSGGLARNYMQYNCRDYIKNLLSTSGEIFKLGVEAEIQTSDKKLGGFYDTLFNMICTNGWTENHNVNDKEYLQNMLKSGAMFIASENSDGYYYQGNYASDSLIREEEDSSAVAEAEAKYNAQKLRLANKEDAIDLKMKNLDTELTALQTEYDSVKKTIDKNISNVFKRYS